MKKTNWRKCNKCRGKGYIRVYNDARPGEGGNYHTADKVCPICKGRGKTVVR